MCLYGTRTSEFVKQVWNYRSWKKYVILCERICKLKHYRFQLIQHLSLNTMWFFMGLSMIVYSYPYDTRVTSFMLNDKPHLEPLIVTCLSECEKILTLDFIYDKCSYIDHLWNKTCNVSYFSKVNFAARLVIYFLNLPNPAENSDTPCILSI